MISEKIFSTIVKVLMIMILTLFIVNSKAVEATRPSVVMKSNKLDTAKLVPVSQVRAPTPPSGPSRCSHLPPANGPDCHHWRQWSLAIRSLVEFVVTFIFWIAILNKIVIYVQGKIALATCQMFVLCYIVATRSKRKIKMFSPRLYYWLVIKPRKFT